MYFTTPYLAGIAATFLAHLALIPLLAFYGSAICPVLRNQGFGFGCVYVGMFVAWIFAASALGMIGAFKLKAGKLPVALFYGVTFAVGAWGLLGYLGSLRVPPSTITRMETALSCAGILLGVLHVEVTDWLINRRARSSVIWELVPPAGALAVLAIVAFRLCEGIAAGELGLGSIELARKELILVTALLGCWLLAIRATRPILERFPDDEDVAAHIEELRKVA